MKLKCLLFALCSIPMLGHCDPANEALIATAYSQGMVVYDSCILIPPVTKPQKAICAAFYQTYNTALQAVNAPFPLVVSLDPSPYDWSSYDICRYETAHLIFTPLTFPVCPTLP